MKINPTQVCNSSVAKMLFCAGAAGFSTFLCVTSIVPLIAGIPALVLFVMAAERYRRRGKLFSFFYGMTEIDSENFERRFRPKFEDVGFF